MNKLQTDFCSIILDHCSIVFSDNNIFVTVPENYYFLLKSNFSLMAAANQKILEDRKTSNIIYYPVFKKV